MAKESKIRFKEANNKVGPDTGMPYQWKYNYDQVLANATGPATQERRFQLIMALRHSKEIPRLEIILSSQIGGTYRSHS